MNRKDKTFEVFRKHQHQLEEMPSPQTWDRLRKRLDNRKKQNPTRSIYRLLSMVAAILGLVLLVATVVNLGNPTKRLAKKTQELPNYSPEVLQKAIAAHTYRTTNEIALQQHIEEGAPNKLLVNKKAVKPILIPKKRDSI